MGGFVVAESSAMDTVDESRVDERVRRRMMKVEKEGEIKS